VDFLSLRRAALFTAVTLAAALLSWALFSDRLPTALARILSPFADIPPASGVVYTVEPGTARVLRGDDVVFTVAVERGQLARPYLELYSLAGAKPLRHELKQSRQGKAWTCTVGTRDIGDGFRDAFQYRVYGGGTWSRLHQVTILDRPEVVAH